MSRAAWRAATFVFALAATQAQAATYYVATDGSNSNDGSANNEWATIEHCVDQLSSSGGDECVVRPGNYDLVDGTNTRVTIDLGGQPGNQNVLRAEFPRWSCDADHTCTQNTTNPTVLRGDGNEPFMLNPAGDHWIIEGFLFDGETLGAFRLFDTSGRYDQIADDVEIRYNEFYGGGGSGILMAGATNWHIHHNMFDDPVSNDDIQDYGIACYAASAQILIEHNVFKGRFNHHFSSKEDCDDVHARENIHLGVGSNEAYNLGQNADEFSGLVAPCSNLVAGDSSTRDFTAHNNLVERNFIGDWDGYGASGRSWEGIISAVQTSNSVDTVIRYNYMENSIIFIRVEGADGQTDQYTGECGDHPEDLDVYGNTGVYAGSWPILITARGWNDDRMRFFNNTWYGSGQQVIRTRNCDTVNRICHPWWETHTLSGTVFEIYNSNHVIASAPFHNDGGDTSYTIAAEGDNNWFQTGGTRGASGDVSVDPGFTGPTTQPPARTTIPPKWSFDGAIEHYYGTSTLEAWQYSHASLIDEGRSIPSTDVQGNSIGFASGTPTGGSTS